MSQLFYEISKVKIVFRFIQGNKKGPVNRWDFDTPEEYGEVSTCTFLITFGLILTNFLYCALTFQKYMNKKEALPKAAYQYGIKMADGRKTRNKAVVKSDKTEKAELDREWQKIQSIMSKRKGGPSSSSDSL